VYSDKVLDHFRNPRNMGEIPDADGVGTVGNPVCGDLMTIYIKVRDNRLEDVKFKTFGCGAAIATSSMITELAKGKTLDEAMKITRGDVADNLGGLPPVKMHCSNLAADGLHAAIQDLCRNQKNDLLQAILLLLRGPCKRIRNKKEEEKVAATSASAFPANVSHELFSLSTGRSGVRCRRTMDPRRLFSIVLHLSLRCRLACALVAQSYGSTGRSCLLLPFCSSI
jgi:nitrogen fixation NifU-like protein